MTIDIEKAINFAAEAHAGQKRKGKETPYIAHPFYVAMLLSKAGADDVTIAAGLLHDYLEDAPGELSHKKQIILETFGEEVLALIAAESEDKIKSWEARKSTTIRKLKQTEDERVLAIACADKAANLHDMVLDYKSVGDALWDRFNRDKKHTAWYYRNIIAVLEEKPGIKSLAMFGQLKRDFNQLFGENL